MVASDAPGSISLQFPSSQPPTLITATDRYIAVASRASISSFQLNPAEPLAEWHPPPRYIITALKLSPDSAALAAVIHRPNDTALVLLHPDSLARLFRIALPTTSSTPVITFVSPPPSSTPDTQSLLPKHLTKAFAQFDDASRPTKPPSSPTAPFALALSPTINSKSPLLLVFHKRYKRIHHLTTLPQTRPRTPLSVPNLTAVKPELVFYDKQAVHYSSPSGFHHINSNFPIKFVLAVVHFPSLAMAAIVEHPQGQTCVAVFRHNSTTLTPVKNPLPNVSLISSSHAGRFLLGALTADGICVVAELFLRPHVIIDVIPQKDPTLSKPKQQNLLCVPPSLFTPLSVVVSNGTVTCQHSHVEQPVSAR